MTHQNIRTDKAFCAIGELKEPTSCATRARAEFSPGRAVPGINCVIRGSPSGDVPDCGEWKGFRSSRLNRQWRLIYRVEKAQLEVHVVEVNPHEY